MGLEGISGQPTTIMPGMKHPVVAGQTLIIKDVNDEEFAVEARDDPLVLEFIDAFDLFRDAQMKGVMGVALEGLARRLEAAYERLPSRVVLARRPSGIVSVR